MPEDASTTCRDKILRLVSEAGSSQQVALKVGCGPQQVINICTGKTDPWELRFHTVQRFVEAYRRHLSFKDFYRPDDP